MFSLSTGSMTLLGRFQWFTCTRRTSQEVQPLPLSSIVLILNRDRDLKTTSKQWHGHIFFFFTFALDFSLLKIWKKDFH